jgi:hypothetical protein
MCAKNLIYINFLTSDTIRVMSVSSSNSREGDGDLHLVLRPLRRQMYRMEVVIRDFTNHMLIADMLLRNADMHVLPRDISDNGLEVWSQRGSLWAGSRSSASHAEELPAPNRESYQGESTQTRVQLQCKSGRDSYFCVEACSQMWRLAFTAKSTHCNVRRVENVNLNCLPAAANVTDTIAAAI